MEAMGKPKNLLEWVRKNRPRDLRADRPRGDDETRRRRLTIN
jgi:hypothetical protein